MQTTIGEVMSRKNAAKYLDVCCTTLDKLDIPRTKIRRRVLYRRDVLDTWLVKQTEGKRARL
jgi:hypothetical protein